MAPDWPAEYYDSMLMELFPGRTLEELDQIDFSRLLRVLKFRSVRSLEDRRRRYLAGDKTIKLDDDDWERIERHDQLFEDFLDGRCR